MKFTIAIAALTIAAATYAEKPATNQSKQVQPIPVMEGGLFVGITLTKDQKQKIVAIMKAERNEMKKQMKELNKSGKSYKAYRKEMRDKIKARKEDRNVAIKAILTPEQLVVFNKKMAEKKANLPRSQKPAPTPKAKK